jgi:sugar-specific transcriptional regulator TrmB
LSLERIFEALVNIGLSESDARVYIYLALKGPKNLRAIISSLKINQQQILLSLKYLQKNDIISQEKENHTRFVALPFEEALKLLIKTQKEQTKILKENFLQKWKAMMRARVKDKSIKQF